MRLRRYTDWIAAAVHCGRTAPPPTAPAAPPPDPEAVARVGNVLHACFPDEQDPIDDALTALMLHLAVVPVDPPVPDKA